MTLLIIIFRLLEPRTKNQDSRKIDMIEFFETIRKVKFTFQWNLFLKEKISLYLYPIINKTIKIYL